MKFLIQRVNEASVQVEGQVIGKIGKGLLVFVGISRSDFIKENHFKGNEEDKYNESKAYEIADKMIKKLIGLRIFEDENGKTNLDMKTVGGQLLIISQFTLYADCHKGNRPSFVNAGEPHKANDVYRYIIDECKKEIDIVEEGSFGAEMKVALINDGPFTIILDSEDICK